MRCLKVKSLTMRIWTTFTAIILIIICSISFLYLVTFKRISENARMHDLKVAHDILLTGNGFNEPNRFGELKNLKGISHFIAGKADGGLPQIVDMNAAKGYLPPQGKDVPPPPGGNDPEMKTWMASFIKGGSIYEKEFKEPYKNRKFLFIISSIPGDKTGNSYLVSYMPDIQDNSLLYTVLVVGAVFIAIGFLTAKVVANHISKPLKQLEDYTVRIARKDWKEPISIKTDDEIERLADSMNRMQKELKRADEEEKMFLQSISHDLKTPVMVIMSHAEAIVDGVYIDSVEKTAEIIRDEAMSLEKKIKQMLYLNTLDYVLENNSENTRIDLRHLLLHIISRFEVVDSSIQWDLNIDELFINGNADKIQVAMENVLDNGIRYAENKIAVSLKQEDSFAVLEIYNDGPNIRPEHLEHIFDNLYKDKTGNFGLGLAISKKVVNFYNGEIKAVNREKGVSFIIRLPL